jgi:ATP-dependent Clp protease ATP-binding subunit ClpA
VFQKLRRARADLATMNALLPEAERIARNDGTDQPGAEHLLLASLGLDGIAADVLGAFGLDGADLAAAVAGQHDETLREIGISADENAISASLPGGAPPRGPYRSQGSLQTAFQHAVSLAKRDRTSLNSGHVLLAVTDVDHGTVGRALRHLGVDQALLRDHTRRALTQTSSDRLGR